MTRFRNGRFLARTASALCLTILISSIPSVTSPQGTGENIITNYGVLEWIAGEAIGELEVNMPPMADSTLVVLKKEDGVGSGIDKVFENVLVSDMKEAGLRVATRSSPAGKDETPAYTFSYQIITYSIKYPKIGRSYWVGAKEVERFAEIGIFAKLIDSQSGEIVWVGETQKDYGDRIAYSLLERVEDPAHEFTMPARNEIRWGRFVEPVVVTGIVVGLVYLFFSNQETN